MENSLSRASGLLQKLSGENLCLAVSLLELLALKEEMEATAEISTDPDLVGQLNGARHSRQLGNYDDYCPWEARHGL
ncbi:hypothetical protein [Desulfurispora thermophila]|uniref:hypothetical protein n=1 Tax=Desulfurispora thermophila TaxID=265470 RepID=UPI00035D1E2C|nr:hypothetical protein [Desulfurispora thermophila]